MKTFAYGFCILALLSISAFAVPVTDPESDEVIDQIQTHLGDQSHWGWFKKKAAPTPEPKSAETPAPQPPTIEHGSETTTSTDEPTVAPVEPVVEKKYCAHRCTAKRERKNWNFMTAAERNLYIEAVQMLYNKGVYVNFVKVHQDGVNDPYAHGSSGFLPWHRKFLMEYENALRCLAPKFECVTIPYWNWAEWQYYCNEQAKIDRVGCKSYHHIPDNMKKDNPNAQSLLEAFGGEGDKNARDGTFGGTGSAAGVGCVTTGPFKGWKDWEGHCLTRGVDWRMSDRKNGPLTDRATLLRLTTREDAYGTRSGYRSGIQGTPHNMAHNYLGGHMRSMRSPMDPIFFSHHAYVDKQWAVWQDCKDHEDLLAHKLGKVHYEGMHRPNLEDDGIDSPMPFLLQSSPFVPNEGCSENAPGGKNNACRDCLGEQQGRSGWCDKRWHPQCVGICSDHACKSKCGSGGGSEPIKVEDFKIAGHDYEYEFNHDKLGETPRHWSIAPGKFAKGAFSYQVEDLDKDLVKETCSMMHGGHEESELSAEELVELEMQNQASSLYSWSSLKSKLSSLFGWFKNDVAEVKRANPSYSSKQVVEEVVQDMTNEQCKARDSSAMCKDENGALKDTCTWKCEGDVYQQSELCGFEAAFNYLANDAPMTISDDCVAYSTNS